MKIFKKVPVKNKNAREKSKKSGREKQNLPVKIFEKCEFLKNFHGQISKNQILAPDTENFLPVKILRKVPVKLEEWP